MPEFPPLKGMRLILTLLFISIGNFMVVLDTTVVNVSVATIAGNLGVSVSEGTWLVTSYAVAEAVTVPLTGWLSLRFGQVRMFVYCMIAFALTSLLCGMAPSLEILVVARILQGLAGGPIIPLSSILLISIFPRGKAGTAMGIWAMTTVVAPVIGPILGGYITETLSWHWIFLINVPLGIIGCLVVWELMKERETPLARKRIDFVGLIYLIIFVGAFQLMLDKGRELDWFSSGFILGCGLTALLALALLVIWELTDENPIIDLSVVKSRSWFISTLAISLIFGVFFGNMLITPIWLQQYMGYTSTWAGLALAPVGILSLFMSPFIGVMAGKLDARIMVTIGLLILALGFWMRVGFTSQVDVNYLAWAMFVLGPGLSFCMITLSTMGVSELPPEKMASGAGLQNFVRVMSMAVGASLSHTLWESLTKTKRAELVAVGDSQQISQMMSGSGLPGETGLALYSHLVDREAVMLALNDFYFYSMLLMMLFALLIWWARPPKPGLKVAMH